MGEMLRGVVCTTALALAVTAAAVPAAAAGAPDAVESQEAAMRPLRDALLAAATPRALILAAQITPSADHLRTQARDLAPDDAFVQWFAAKHADGSVDVEAAHDVVRLEPDNGAGWVLLLDAAADAGDEDGVTRALEQIGEAPRFDDFLSTMTREWLAVIDAEPALVPTVERGSADWSRAAAPLVHALALSAAVGMPAYRKLVEACPRGGAADPARHLACAAAGQRISEQATSIVARAIGTALLRRIDDPAWTVAKQHYDHLNRASSTLLDPALRDDAAIRRVIADWYATASEIAVLERLLARAGLPLRAPADAS